ncbi:acyl-ACP desaturase, partial [Gordonia sp. HY442]
MPDLTQVQLLTELEPAAEAELNRHLSLTRDWHPHDYVPWDEGRNFAAMGGEDWDPEQSRLDPVAKAAMTLNLLTEDNLPSYHREITEYFSPDGAWGTWVGRWTAEENRHGIVMRDYLVVTRGVDPVALENDRMANMTKGAHSDDLNGLMRGVAYVAVQELGTRVSHKNTGKACNDPVADRMLQRIAADENLHMIFYRNICAAALDLAPDQAMEAIAGVVSNFDMPGIGMPNFRRMSLTMAKHGIYDIRQH